MVIPFLSLHHQHESLRNELESAFRRVLNGERFVMGGEVDSFQREFAAYSGVDHCIGVANGLDALFISLKVLGVGNGDAVVVPALTCSPTWIAVMRTGAQLVPVDADPATWQMDLSILEKSISRNVKAIVPVNLYGRPENLGTICKMAEASGIAVVEDNAQGHGASQEGKKTGSFGRINATSFYPTKNLGALGDGGAITTSDPDLAHRAKIFANYGASRRFNHDEAGINSRLDELQAAFLRCKLKYLDQWNQERARLAACYRKRLQGIGDLQMPEVAEDAVAVYHLFVVRTQKRDKLINHLKKAGIETDVHYPVPPHRQGFSPFHERSFPIAESICNSILSLPLWPGLKESEIELVCDNIKGFFQ